MRSKRRRMVLRTNFLYFQEALEEAIRSTKEDDLPALMSHMNLIVMAAEQMTIHLDGTMPHILMHEGATDETVDEAEAISDGLRDIWKEKLSGYLTLLNPDPNNN